MKFSYAVILSALATDTAVAAAVGSAPEFSVARHEPIEFTERDEQELWKRRGGGGGGSRGGGGGGSSGG